MPPQRSVTLPPAHGKRAGERCTRWHRALAAHTRPTTGIRDPDMHREENSGPRSRLAASTENSMRVRRRRQQDVTRTQQSADTLPAARIQTALTAGATWCGSSTISYGVATRAAHAVAPGGKPPPPTSRLILPSVAELPHLAAWHPAHHHSQRTSAVGGESKRPEGCRGSARVRARPDSGGQHQRRTRRGSAP